MIIGAGPAGLTAALELAKRGVTPRIFEASGNVGGLARTPTDGAWSADPGGHRFFTKSEEIAALWRSLLPADQWLSVRRRSAMLVNGQYMQYPLVGRDLLRQNGFRSGLHGLSSLLGARLRGGMHPIDNAASFRDWGTRQFGSYWYNIFFDGYVRKTWLSDPDELSSDWANQRIRPIDWRRPRRADLMVQDVFQYPRCGPGQLWEAAAAALADVGIRPCLNSCVTSIRRVGETWVVELESGETVSGDAVFSSMPLQRLIDALQPDPPQHIRAAAASLKHRSVIIAAVALQKRYDIPYHWVYTPGNNLRVGRIQNYGMWSSALAPDGFSGTHLGLEYFTLPGDDLWVKGSESLGDIVEQDLRTLGLGDSALDHFMIVRSEFAYPIYDPARDRSVARIRNYLSSGSPLASPHRT